MTNKTKKTTKKNKSTGITKEHNLGELVFNYPKTAEILIDFGLHCVGCAAAHFDTIEAGARVHGMRDEDIEEMIERINEVIEFDE